MILENRVLVIILGRDGTRGKRVGHYSVQTHQRFQRVKSGLINLCIERSLLCLQRLVGLVVVW